MSARRVVVAGTEEWVRVMRRVARRYGSILGSQPPDVAARGLIAATAGQAPNAYQRGAVLVATAARAAGARDVPLTSITPPAPAVGIARDVRAAWLAAEHHPAPDAARAAAVDRVMVQNLALAWRTGQADQVTDTQEIIGYRRVADGDACTVCLALDTGAIVADDTPFEAHPGCQCAMEPVTSDRPPPAPSGQDRFDQMTTAQQDLLFYGRGGPELAEMVRSGRVSLTDLVRRYPRKPGQTPVVGQRPLRDFT